MIDLSIFADALDGDIGFAEAIEEIDASGDGKLQMSEIRGADEEALNDLFHEAMDFEGNARQELNLVREIGMVRGKLGDVWSDAVKSMEPGGGGRFLWMMRAQQRLRSPADGEYLPEGNARAISAKIGRLAGKIPGKLGT